MSSDDKEYGNVSIVISLTSDMNKRLTLASERSQRSKTKEATLRLHDHLINFDDIATLGKRFTVDEGE
ncbi:TraY domain-containing protein [Yersinia ruckeri]|uniref:TraY domain-containing protein n=1 Tax=Yersinia ruckeri TaxID=29486 RepID=UPI0005367650|nr:TraY domain-containing protein [Yersinia ruckeri]AUQ43893.1 TraY domain-containing protein [Yersinia ruckeri]WMS07314.1 TraY domain-containing protein [Yersinia ruckeri]